MSEAEGVYLARRVKDQPIPLIECETRKCTQCGEDVWLDKAARTYWTRLTIICTVCFAEIRPPRKFKVEIPPEILGSLKKFFESQRRMKRK